MRLRRYRTEDLPILARLFGETVRQVNCRDYTLPQVEAWAAGEGGSADTGQLVSAAVHPGSRGGRADCGLRQCGGYRLSGPPVRPVGLPGTGHRRSPV